MHAPCHMIHSPRHSKVDFFWCMCHDFKLMHQICMRKARRTRHAIISGVNWELSLSCRLRSINLLPSLPHTISLRTPWDHAVKFIEQLGLWYIQDMNKLFCNQMTAIDHESPGVCVCASIWERHISSRTHTLFRRVSLNSWPACRHNCQYIHTLLHASAGETWQRHGHPRPLRHA
jgi:hypothetical protein